MLFRQVTCIALAILFPAVVCAAPPTTAVKFFIERPIDDIVGTPVTVTVHAHTSNNKIDTTFEQDVTLVTSGGATGGGLVNIVHGVGSRDISDALAETVTLSLLDTEATGLDVSDTAQLTFSSTTGGGAPRWSQQRFLFRDDDGTEVTATGYGGENIGVDTGIGKALFGSALRLRFAVKLSVASGVLVPRLEFKEGVDCTMGTWMTVTPTSTPLKLYPALHFTDGEPTTQQIVSGTHFVAGKIFATTNPGPVQVIEKAEQTEYEWLLSVAELAPFSTTYSLRMTNGDAAFDNYVQCPTLTTEPTNATGFGDVRLLPTTVTFSGRAFPEATILVVDKDIHAEKVVSQKVVTNERGMFELSFVDIAQSLHSFGLLIKDREGRITQTKFFAIDILANELVVKNVFMSPTLGLAERTVTRGRNVRLTGYASPESVVRVEVDGRTTFNVTTATSGMYTFALSTGDLAFGAHQVRVQQIDPITGEESDLSSVQVFTVVRLVAPRFDLNGDGKIDLKDWSIFASHWVSKNTIQRKVVDLNGDGKTDLADFSMFIRVLRK